MSVGSRTACVTVAVAIAAIFGAASGANADGYSPPPRVALTPTTWTGFYVGVHGGYGWGDDDFAEVVALNPLRTLGGIDAEGAVFGGQAGYNWQSGSVVGGLEIDISGSDIDGTSAPFIQNLGGGVTTSDTVANDVEYLGTVRGRLGYSGFSNFLVYATGGIA